MNGKSLSFKILALFASVIILFAIVFNIYPLLTTQKLMVESIKGDLLQTANIVSSSVSGLQSLDVVKVNSVMSILDISGSERMIVTDDSGLVLYDSSEYENSQGKYNLMPELVGALEGRDSFHCVFADGAFESIVAVPIAYDSTIMGAVYIYEYDVSQGGLLLSMQSNVRIITLVLVVISTLLVGVFVIMMRKRLDKLSVAVRELREGNYNHRIDIHGEDEIGRIAEEFNELSSRLEDTEARRRLFVSNASHELKTPLASIKLLTDSILQNEGMSMEDVRDFLSDVSEEISRLTRITDKLLKLTRLDVALHQEFELVNVSYIVERAAHMLVPLAEHYEVTISCDTTENCLVFAEEDGIYQVVFNLMENATKYNRRGGTVHAMTYIKDDMVTCIVDDTGIGMPKSELGHIFERFYRIDKARSRETGGTGLGLSIVRRTVEQYGGRVWAENREPEGSRFVFTIPVFNSKGTGESAESRDDGGEIR